MDPEVGARSREGEGLSLARAIRALGARNRLEDLEQAVPRVAALFSGAGRAWLVERIQGIRCRLAAAFGPDTWEPSVTFESAAMRLPMDECTPRLVAREEMEEWCGDGWRPEPGESFVVVPMAQGGVSGGFLVLGDLTQVLETAGPVREGLEVIAAYALARLRHGETHRSIERSRTRLWSCLEQFEQAEEHLAEVQRLQTAGQLVRGLAHELNNPLTALSGYAQVLAGMSPEDLEANRSYFTKINEQAMRCTVLLSKLLAFVRRAVNPSRDLRGVIEDSLALKTFDLRRAGISVQVDVPASARIPSMEQTELQQVLLNLLDNAIQALSGEEVREITVSAREEEGRVSITVSDTGRGIPREIRGRIFDPFFTTMPRPESAGLGLYVCVDLLSRASGSLTLFSEEGWGSRFTIRLPARRPSSRSA